MALSKGIFITFEGGEGAGKTTLMESVAKQLQSEGYPILKTREPGGTKMGEEIRHLLLQHSEIEVSPYAELCLFLASRAQHVSQVIGPALEERKIVLCDRFSDSTIAYQGAARGLGVERVAEFSQFVSQGVEPHLTLYLDIDPKIGIERAKRSRKQDRIEAETLAFHAKIREAFHAIQKNNSHRLHLIHAEQPLEKVYSDAMGLIENLLSRSHV